jgi:hypothetical protein
MSMIDPKRMLRLLKQASRPFMRLFLRWARYPVEPGMPPCWRPRGRAVLRLWRRATGRPQPGAAWNAAPVAGPEALPQGSDPIGEAGAQDRFMAFEDPTRLRVRRLTGLRFVIEVVRPPREDATLALVVRAGGRERLAHPTGISELAARAGGAPLSEFEIGFRSDEIAPGEEVTVLVAGETAALCRGGFDVRDFGMQAIVDLVEWGDPPATLPEGGPAAFFVEAMETLRAAMAESAAGRPEGEALADLQLGLIDRALRRDDPALLEALTARLSLDRCVFHRPGETIRRVVALQARGVVALQAAVRAAQTGGFVPRSRVASANMRAVAAVAGRQALAPTTMLLDLRDGLQRLNFGQDAMASFMLAAQRALPAEDAAAFRDWAVRAMVARHRPAAP